MQFWKSCPKISRQESEWFLLKFQKHWKKIAQKIYFNPKCFFGHIKCKFDETNRNSHRESETIYLEVRILLRRKMFFFQNNISLKLFRWHKECNFDNTAEQLSSEVRKVFPQIRKQSKNWKKNTKFSSSKWSSGTWSSALETLPKNFSQKRR